MLAVSDWSACVFRSTLVSAGCWIIADVNWLLACDSDSPFPNRTCWPPGGTRALYQFATDASWDLDVAIDACEICGSEA